MSNTSESRRYSGYTDVTGSRIYEGDTLHTPDGRTGICRMELSDGGELGVNKVERDNTGGYEVLLVANGKMYYPPSMWKEYTIIPEVIV